MFGYPNVEKKYAFWKHSSTQSGPFASVICCSAPSTPRASPFHTTIASSVRLPRLSSACFAATIAVSAGTNHITTLRCSILLTQNGKNGISGFGSAPAWIAG